MGDDWELPAHFTRYWTGEAIDTLARRFNLPNHYSMQDWPWEAADCHRIDEFLAAYESAEYQGSEHDDERFLLMEILLQCAEDLGPERGRHPAWKTMQMLLDRNIKLHLYSVWYWACLDNDNLADAWDIAPFMRSLLNKHKARFGLPAHWEVRI